MDFIKNNFIKKCEQESFFSGTQIFNFLLLQQVY